VKEEDKTMLKYQSTRALPILVTLLLAASASVGQSKRDDVIANIPFPFFVANRALPPGRYIVTAVGDVDICIYSSKNQAVLIPTHRMQGRAPESVGKVIFHRYGDAYFLSEVWVAANDIGRQLFTSRAEKESAAKGTSSEIAVLRTTP
jgi:hypothetical protein